VILTVPNFISALRIAAVPVFLWLLLGRDDSAAAGWLLGSLGATDWVDGWLARRLGQVSELGKILDPIGDRLAIAAALVGGWISGALPWWIALLLIVRESVVSLGALLVVARARARIDVRLTGKAATLAVYVAVANFLIYDGTEHIFFGTVAWTFIIPGLILYYVVAAQYFFDVRRILATGPDVSSDSPEREE
jgi:cardiolipin synthase